MPQIILLIGMSRERQVYLYEKIRPFCSSETADLTCPKPQMDTTTTQAEQTESVATVTRPDIPRQPVVLLRAHSCAPSHIFYLLRKSYDFSKAHYAGRSLCERAGSRKTCLRSGLRHISDRYQNFPGNKDSRRGKALPVGVRPFNWTVKVVQTKLP